MLNICKPGMLVNEKDIAREDNLTISKTMESEHVGEKYMCIGVLILDFIHRTVGICARHLCSYSIGPHT